MCHGISSKILVKTREMKNSHRNFIYFLATIYLSELTIIVLLGHSRLLVELKNVGEPSCVDEENFELFFMLNSNS